MEAHHKGLAQQAHQRLRLAELLHPLHGQVKHSALAQGNGSLIIGLGSPAHVRLVEGVAAHGQHQADLVVVAVGPAHGIQRSPGYLEHLHVIGDGQFLAELIVAGHQGLGLAVQLHLPGIESPRQGVLAVQILVVVAVGHGHHRHIGHAVLHGNAELQLAGLVGIAMDPAVVALVGRAVAIGHSLLIGAHEQLLVAAAGQGHHQIGLTVLDLQPGADSLEHAGVVGDGQVDPLRLGGLLLGRFLDGSGQGEGDGRRHAAGDAVEIERAVQVDGHVGKLTGLVGPAGPLIGGAVEHDTGIGAAFHGNGSGGLAVLHRDVLHAPGLLAGRGALALAVRGAQGRIAALVIGAVGQSGAVVGGIKGPDRPQRGLQHAAKGLARSIMAAFLVQGFLVGCAQGVIIGFDGLHPLPVRGGVLSGVGGQGLDLSSDLVHRLGAFAEHRHDAREDHGQCQQQRQQLVGCFLHVSSFRGCTRQPHLLCSFPAGFLACGSARRQRLLMPAGTMAFAAPLPAHSDRIARDLHPVPFYPPARHWENCVSRQVPSIPPPAPGRSAFIPPAEVPGTSLLLSAPPRAGWSPRWGRRYR